MSTTSTRSTTAKLELHHRLLKDKAFRASLKESRSPSAPFSGNTEGNHAVREGRWKLVSKFPDSWELYDMEADRTEMHDIADENPERVRQMSADYSTWAKRVGVRPWPMPETPRGSERTGAMSAPDYLLKDRM